ncbi:MAG: hypothetical protein ACP5OF_05100 [bacterium]
MNVFNSPIVSAATHLIEEVERVPVVSLNRYGKRLAVVLDRAINKRCDFLFLTKRYKTQEGEYGLCRQ